MEQKFRIMYVITSLDYGGTQKQLYCLLKWLNGRMIKELGSAVELIVISLKRGGRVRDKFLKLKQIPIHDLGLPEISSILNILIFPYSIIKFFYLVLKYKPKMIHSFLFQANFISRFAKVLSPKIKLICSERVAEQQKKWHLLFSRLTNFLVDSIVVNSEDLKKFVIKTQKVSDRMVRVIPNAIETEEMKVNRQPKEIRSELEIENEKFLVVSCGRLHKQKGYDLLIEIAKKINSEPFISNSVMFVIIGDGEEHNKLIRRLKDYRLENVVKFIGYKENVYDYINACDLFLLTSLWEGSPNVLLEALYFNKPVISTEVCGVREIIGNNEEYIVQIYKEKGEIINEFVKKIKNLYTKRELQVIPRFKIEKYSPKNVIDKFLALYIELSLKK